MSNAVSGAERVRRAIALLTQARHELMLREEVDQLFHEAGATKCQLAGTQIGTIRCNLQVALRKLGEPETLDPETLESVLESMRREGE